MKILLEVVELALLGGNLRLQLTTLFPTGYVGTERQDPFKISLNTNVLHFIKKG